VSSLALRFIARKGRWQVLNNGPEVLQYEDPCFLMIFYLRRPVPVELRTACGIGPLHHGLYSLELWDKEIGKVLNLAWDSVGATPRIVTFRRGEWEHLFLQTSAAI